MTLRPRDKAILAAVLVLIAGFGFYKFALTPQRHEAKSLDAKIATAHADLANAEQEYAAGHAAQAALKSGASVYAAAQRAVPQSADIPQLLRVLSRSAAAAHVSMQSISLDGSGTGSTTPAVATSSDGATEIPVSLSFGGGYQALNRLVNHLDGLVVAAGSHGLTAAGPLIGISNVTLNPGTSGLTVQLTASIYQHAQASSAIGTATEGTS